MYAFMPVDKDGSDKINPEIRKRQRKLFRRRTRQQKNPIPQQFSNEKDPRSDKNQKAKRRVLDVDCLFPVSLSEGH